jgi:hypothetical protein
LNIHVRRLIAVRLLGKGDCPALSSESDLPLDTGCRVAIIDLRVFVPEVVSVLSTFSQDSFKEHLKVIPFIDGIIGRANPPKNLYIANDQSAAELITLAVLNSEMEVLRLLSHAKRQQVATQICNLQQVKTLYGTQLEAFAGGLANNVHCTHGPPGSGKSFVGVALVLALVIIREAAQSDGKSLGPVLMLSYKNHALDEFLIDVINWSSQGIIQGMLIRTGKPDRQELLQYSERHNPAQMAAEVALTERISTLRKCRRLLKDFQAAKMTFHVRFILFPISI